MKVVDIHIPKLPWKKRRERAVTAQLRERRESVGGGMGDEAHTPMKVLDQATCGEPPHAGRPKTWKQLLVAGCKRRNEIGNVGRLDGKGKGAEGEPRRRKRKKVKRCDHVLLGKREDVVIEKLEPFPLVGKGECGNVPRQWELERVGRDHVDHETEDFQPVG